MRTFIKRSKFIIPIILIILLLIRSTPTYSQSESEAQSIIQEADDKLIEIFKLLEDASESNIGITDLIQETDYARDQIKEAKIQFSIGNYNQAYQDANEAIEELDSVLFKINQRMYQRKQNSKILYSVLGVLAALFTIGFVLVFIKKIQPWFKIKQLEEYGKLEIKYEVEGNSGEENEKK